MPVRLIDEKAATVLPLRATFSRTVDFSPSPRSMVTTRLTPSSPTETVSPGLTLSNLVLSLPSLTVKPPAHSL
ncbi:hypothetical protein [Streptomyces sp. NPDC058613]|uniref:hypothetical protein n=1 Tax=unclassified Streptomyces TaxID=2593676 RepID=UPI003669861B